MLVAIAIVVAVSLLAPLRLRAMAFVIFACIFSILLFAMNLSQGYSLPFAGLLSLGLIVLMQASYLAGAFLLEILRRKRRTRPKPDKPEPRVYPPLDLNDPREDRAD